MNTLPILFGYNLSGLGNSSVPMAFCRYWNTQGYPSLLYAPSAEAGISSSRFRPALGPLARKMFYRFSREKTSVEKAVEHILKHESNSRYVYLWAGLSLGVFKQFHRRGSTIIVERTNCHQATARRILDEAYTRLGLRPAHGISEESITAENRKLELADAVFCPSPKVYSSMLENGVDPDKLLLTSYGWEPDRFTGMVTSPRGNGKPVFLFVGSLCVRKGVPLLLTAWDKAAIDGTLILCGEMEEEISQNFGRYFRRDDVVHVPYTGDIGKYYEMADVFVFPSLEEGGPMVTYEAMAHGAVPLVSEMGAGSIVQNRKNGLIVPHEVEAWVIAMMAVSQNVPKRVELGRAARARALEFTWQKVAKSRGEQLSERFPALW